ncbi:Daunorubicin/doxorubicin resistance ATP-binding protein DrrA [Enhygromyxa salina]|uniref:Daunorubicin/doxorubicin resistance ATP-binding protein DrrA n=1 Tax=Enhygromyxa salina TaxID=215803 RepID=A0A2S9YAQ8_9BACT|nr:ABC transporter ATP-binding protein [Enhygromyxa salina]PRQ02142.1 Daunorubicin/doxorubicin resistance ATP-binding protein DrrA [Enhygromyxa salina]
MLELVDLRKSHGRTLALDGVSLRVDAGEILGLLGPNGAGKSTLVSLVAGLIAPDAEGGELRLAVAGGVSGSPRDPAVRRHIGLAPQSLALYAELTGAENLRFFAGLQGCRAEEVRARVDWALDFVGLSERRDHRVKTYSGGMARRLNLAAALVHDPALLLLDEPTVGVDPQSRERLLDNILDLRGQGKAVLYTTHYMEEAQRICDRVAIIDRGQLLSVGRTDALLAAHAGKPKLVVEFEDGRETVETDTPLATLNELAEGRAPLGFRVERPTLEQVFLELTGRSLRE